MMTSSFLENTKQELKKKKKKKILWKEYRSELTAQPKNRNLDYMIDSKFWHNINRLFVLLFKNSFDNYNTAISRNKIY